MKRKNLSPIKNQRQESALFRQRFGIMTVIFLTLGLLLIARLVYLEIIRFSQYQTLSKRNQINILSIPPTRGLIYDRNKRLLAKNIPVYSLEVIPEKIADVENLLKNINHIIALSPEDIAQFKRSLKQHRVFEPVPLKVKLTEDDVARFAVNQHFFKGVEIKARLIREYPYGALTAHILGYVGRINANELNSIDAKNYSGTNFIGKVGIEKFYETRLHGHVGYQKVETDASGRIVRHLEQTPSQPGDHLVLSIDIELQRAATAALEGHQGAVVAIEPKTGELLALVSVPSYDPNLFVQGISQVDYDQLAHSQQQPLYNRAIRGQYPLASTIKPFLALAALEDNIVSLDYRIYDPGWYKLPNVQHLYRDWKRGGHGWITLEKALIVSCDTYFYHLANLMGIGRIDDILSKFGFGQLTHLDMGEELPGLLPSPHWKFTTKQTHWYSGDTLISGIGQGFMLTTPLQLASATAKLANRGRHFRPHLVTHTFNKQTSTVVSPYEEYPVILKNKKIWKIIIDAMGRVITDRAGTGFRFGRNPSYTVAAKTGTAQVYSIKQQQFETQDDLPEHLRDHSLFIGFAPKEDPKIAIAVIVENNNFASNVARKVIDNYLEREFDDQHRNQAQP